MNVINRYYECAKIASNLSGISEKWLYAQWAHETANFTSALCKEYNNLGGVTQEEPNDTPQPDGSFYYMQFNSPEAYAIYFGRYLRYYREDGVFEAKNIQEYAEALKRGGYYGDTVENYIAGMESAYNHAFPVSEGS